MCGGKTVYWSKGFWRGARGFFFQSFNVSATAITV
jgi:hypothetical protein